MSQSQDKIAPVIPLGGGKKNTSTKAVPKKSPDEIVINPPEKVNINERFLDVVQRLKRGQAMRRREPVLQLKKAAAKFRPHTLKQLKLKASQIAKSRVRARFGGTRGANYGKLGIGDKVSVDRSLESKAKLVKGLAKRLLPQLRSADIQHLTSVRKGERKGIAKFLNRGTLNQSTEYKLIDALYEMITEKDMQALEQKALTNNMSLEIIREIFARGLSESTKQRAFERVNSFIAGGAARRLDEDMDKKDRRDKRERDDGEGEDVQDTSDFKLSASGRKVRAGRIRFEQLEDGTKRIVLEAKKMKGEDPCWDGYHMVGTKKKGGKEVPNCVPEEAEPQIGDAVDIELGDMAYETSVAELAEDGVIVEVDQTTFEALLDAQAELIEAEIIVTPRRKIMGEPPKGSYAWERKYGKYTAKGTLRKKPNPNKPPEEIKEAEYQGRDVPLGKPMAGDVKKSKVYVKGPSGRVVKVNFGDKNMTIKKDNPARRKSFRARHNCDNPGPRHKARYWSCRAW